MIEAVTVKEGETVSRPQDPTKEGTVFIDWYLSKNYEGEPYNFSSPVNSDIILYALCQIMITL